MGYIPINTEYFMDNLTEYEYKKQIIKLENIIFIRNIIQLFGYFSFLIILFIAIYFFK